MLRILFRIRFNNTIGGLFIDLSCYKLARLSFNERPRTFQIS